MSQNDDLISRQAAIDGKICIQQSNGVEICDDYAVPVEYLKQLPPAQPERKTATWLIRKWGGDAKCSNCGRYFKDVYDMENYDNFCRHCGTQMKGIEQHE